MPSCRNGRRVEDYRAQVATLSLNFFYFLTPHTATARPTANSTISIMTRSRAPQSLSLIPSWRVIAAGVLIVVADAYAGFSTFIFTPHRPNYARPSPSIMPGQTWRDNGHKALCPLSCRLLPGGTSCFTTSGLGAKTGV